MDKFSSLFIKLDILSPDVKFNFQSQNAFKSIAGAIFSISVFMLLSLLGILWIIPVVNYENPQTSLSRIINKDLLINFTDFNFPFAFAAIDIQGNSLVDQDQYFKADIIAVNLNGNYSSFDILNISKCSYNLINSDFGEMNNAYANLIFPSAINQTYCFPSNRKNYYINNTHGSSYSRELVIFISYCDNSTMNNTCKSNEIIQNTLRNFFFYFMLTDILIDHSKINPINKIISYKPYSINPTITTTLFINYKKIHYQNDFNLFFSNKTSEKYIQIDSKLSELSEFNTSRLIKNTFFELIISIDSQISDVYSRIYTKIPQILA